MGSKIGIDRRRLDFRLGAICTVANLAGAVFVYLYLTGLAPTERLRHGSGPDAIAFTVFGLCAFSLEAWWSQRSWNRALGWLAEHRTPSASEQDATLRLPMREAARSSVAWAVGAVFFAVFTVSSTAWVARRFESD